MSHIFLSYSRKDAAKAQRLAEVLEGQGLSVWWDRTIPPGKTFDQVIEEALEAANWVVVLWSSHSIDSNWVKAEASEALSRGVLVPVLIEKVRSPLAFRRIEAAELQKWNGDVSDPEFSQLVRVLGGQAPPPKPAPPPTPEPPHPQPPDPRPGPRPPSHGMSSRAKIAIGLAVAFLALVAVGIGVVAMVGRQMSDPPPDLGGTTPFEQPLVESQNEEQRPERIVEEPQEEVRARSRPVTGNIVLQYLGDNYGCLLDLEIRVGNQSFVPTGNILPVSGLALGPTQYAVNGAIGCPNAGTCSASGSGTLEVYDGAVFNLLWVNAALGQCQVSLVDSANN